VLEGLYSADIESAGIRNIDTYQIPLSYNRIDMNAQLINRPSESALFLIVIKMSIPIYWVE
jgi:hypothetical protein